MSTNKAAKTYKKSPYGNAKHFTNIELYAIITKYRQDKTKDKKSWMSLDTKNESKTEKMEKNKVRYLQVMITDQEGKDRPLIRDLAPSKTQSKCKLGATEDGKISTSASFSTRILVMEEAGDKITSERARKVLNPVDDDEWEERVKEFKIPSEGTFEVTQEFVDTAITVQIETIVDTQFPDISDDLRTETVKRQEGLLRQQYIGWCVDKAIAEEFERLLGSKTTQKEIGWTKKADQKIAANVQRDRNCRENNEEDDKIIEELREKTGNDKLELIPLDNWMVYYRIRIDSKDGSLWCKIYDAAAKTAKGAPRKLVTMKNPETGKIEVLNNKTIEAYLRYDSRFTGFAKYSLCISTVGGARLHAALSELAVIRGAKGVAQDHLEEECVNALADFGGMVDGGDDDDDDEEDEKTKAPAKKAGGGKTALEKQMDAIDAAAADDE